MVTPKKPGPALCPDCYLTMGEDVPMIIRQGSALKCPKGHTWGSGGDSDNPGSISGLEVYDQRQAMARHKREQMAMQADPNLKEPAGPTVSAAVQSNTGAEITIDKENRDRITSLVGDFGDAATLYGTIFSLVQDMKTLQEELRTARSAPATTAAVKDINGGLQQGSGGDLAVTILIPERHVVPLKDIAEANSCELPEYVNAIIGNGLDSNWFY